MVYTVHFFGMNTECCKFPSTLKIAKTQDKRQIDVKKSRKNVELEK